MTHLHRRSFLSGLAGAAFSTMALPRALAQTGGARRIVFFYFPDGVVGPSQDGDPSQWHVRGDQLPDALQPLEAYRSRTLFFRGLSMGPVDSGSHPGGAKKLLTAANGGSGRSIDQELARTAGADRPVRHIYLGAQATVGSNSGDTFISYPAAGRSAAPEDDPRQAFARLFATAPSPETPGATSERSVLDAMRAELEAFRGGLGGAERAKLELHLESLRELEQRIAATPPPSTSCEPSRWSGPAADTSPEAFPGILRAQTELMVLAMQCGLSRVGVVQASHHTSELIMSRFEGSPMYDPGFDMRSHQASHYGPRHDESKREYRAFAQQRRWWVEQYRALLDLLDARPEGDGTMLDHSLVVLCTEVSDGNTHSHDDMPFIVTGGSAGALRTGRSLDVGGRRHGALWAALAHAMGTPMNGFGDANPGVLREILA